MRQRTGFAAEPPDELHALHLGRNSQEQLLLGQKRVFGLPYLHARGGFIRAIPLSEGPQSPASRLISRPERSTPIL
jgi:hypothetical protein